MSIPTPLPTEYGLKILFRELNIGLKMVSNTTKTFLKPGLNLSL